VLCRRAAPGAENIALSRARAPTQRGGYNETPRARQNSAFRISHFAFHISHSAFRIPHFAFRIPHSAFRIPHSAFRIPHFAFRIPHSAFPSPSLSSRQPENLLGSTRMASDSPLHQPHDKLFKAGFSDPANAAAFLRHQIPEALAERIRWDALALEPGTFVDSQFRESESDLLFSAPVSGGAGCLIYLLFEHQRNKDPSIALRLLRYQVRIWEKFLGEHPKADKLPVILPIVVAQNAESWHLSPRFADLLDLSDGLENVLDGRFPDFLYQMIELADLPFEKIVGTPAGILILRTLKAERVHKLLDAQVWDEKLLVQMPRALFECLLLYIFSHADVDKDAFTRNVKSIGSAKIQSTAMTLAQQFRQEGLSQGLSQGRILALQESVAEALSIRFDRVPEGLREAIRDIADEPQLRILHKAALQAESLEAFAGAL
jgi:predicted transposase/invertase (TIGR01784 family)